MTTPVPELVTQPVSSAVSYAAARLTRARYFKGVECPDCCAREQSIEDNGCTGVELTYLCTECGHQWDAETYNPDDTV